MKRYALIFIGLFVSGYEHVVVGQVMPVTNNHSTYTDLRAKKTINRLYQKLVSGVQFDNLARQYSQDYGSYNEGGALGWQKSSQFVPAFEKVILDLNQNQFSKPFRTEFGYHIVQLLNRQDEKVLTRHILLRVDK